MRILFAIAILATTCILDSSRLHAQTADPRPNPLWAVNTGTLEEVTLRNIENLARQADQIIGIEVWVAASSGRQVQSRFGHSLLRFVMRSGASSNSIKDRWTTDPVLGFVADVPGKLSRWKGLVGGYAMVPIVLPMSSFWKMYVRAEGREIRRTVLVSNADMRRRLAETLLAWAKNLKSLGDYKFITANCATQLSKLLRESGFATIGSAPIRPKSVPKHFGENLYASYPSLVIPSLYESLERARKILGVSPLDFVKGDHWPEDAAQKLMVALSPIERVRMIQELTLLPSEVRTELSRSIQEAGHGGNQSITLREIIGVLDVPEALYEICESFECGDTHHAIASQIWGTRAMSKHARTLKQNFAELVYRSELRSRRGAVPIPIAVLHHYQYTVGNR